MDAEVVGVFEAKTHLSALIEQVCQGKSFTITKHKVAVARLCPIAEERSLAKRGAARSSDFYMAADFDEPLADFAEYA